MAVAGVQRPVRPVPRGDGTLDIMSIAACGALLHAAPRQSGHFRAGGVIDEVIDTLRMPTSACSRRHCTTPQARFMLPNKLFEYLMAGLMVIVSMQMTSRRWFGAKDCGLVLSDVLPSTLAAGIDALGLDEICRCKDRARESAHSCWDQERASSSRSMPNWRRRPAMPLSIE